MLQNNHVHREKHLIAIKAQLKKVVLLQFVLRPNYVALVYLKLETSQKNCIALAVVVMLRTAHRFYLQKIVRISFNRHLKEA